MARIAHIANLYGPKSGGLRTTVDALGDCYVREGHQVLSVVPGVSFEVIDSGQLTRVVIPGVRIPFSGGYRVILRINLVKQQLLKFAPDVLEVSDRTTLLLVARWAKRRGILTYFFAHERVDGVLKAFFPHLFFRKQFGDQWNKYTYKSVHGIIATTKFAATEFWEMESKTRTLLKSKISQVPLGVYLEKFIPKTFHSPLTSQEKGSGDYFFACTRLSKEKDPFFILEIAAELRKHNLDKLILVAGDGPLRKKLVAQADANELNVHFLGYIGDKEYLNELMANAHAFLAVGPIETFGLAALESLASGTPVICRDSSAISEVIDSDSGAALPRSAQRWVAALTELLSSDRNNLSHSARMRAEIFPWSKSGKSLLQIYQIAA